MRKNKSDQKFTLRLTVCPGAGAFYLGLNRHLKVARTVVKREWPLVAVDFSETGKVVGIESVGMDDFSIGQICEIAGVELTTEMLQGLVVRQEQRQPEAVCA
jgi:hypothetical protein